MVGVEPQFWLIKSFAQLRQTHSHSRTHTQVTHSYELLTAGVCVGAQKQATLLTRLTNGCLKMHETRAARGAERRRA